MSTVHEPIPIPRRPKESDVRIDPQGSRWWVCEVNPDGQCAVCDEPLATAHIVDVATLATWTLDEQATKESSR